MARDLRLHLPGGFYHVTLRGNHRQPIFFAESDRDLLDEVVSEVIHKLGARIHAYCWMTNHIHLLAQVSDAPLGRIVLCIASRYARSVQKRINTTGHLFERRYHAVLVDADNYLLTLVRYIHFNPVRGGLATDPQEYRWSSHRVYLGLGPPEWVTTSFALKLFATDPAIALAGYRRFMGVPEDCRWGDGKLIPNKLHRQILGDDEFVSRVAGIRWAQPHCKSLDELIIECGRRFALDPVSIISASRARDLSVARAWLSHEAVSGRVATVSALARHLGRSEAAVRRLMARHPQFKARQ